MCNVYLTRFHLSQQCPVIVWDLNAAFADAKEHPESEEDEEADISSKYILYNLLLHKGSIQAVDISSCGNYLASLGGQNDNSLVIWDLNDGQPICGSPAATHQAYAVQWGRTRSDMLITAGQYNIRRWDFSHERRRVSPRMFLIVVRHRE